MPSKESPLIVVAFGGNALLRRGEKLTIEAQRQNAEVAAAAVAGLVTDLDLRVCCTHGNGPQVGLLAQQDAESGMAILGAETEGQIGFLLEAALADRLENRADVATLLTQTIVDPHDPAFEKPTKHIGRWYSEEEAKKMQDKLGWSIAPDGDQWRRVVASPRPKAIVEAKAIQVLLDAGLVVICCGGGGIPVAIDTKQHRRYGVEAVIDKDASSALLAANLGAHWLALLTDAGAIFDPEQWPDKEVPLKSPITVGELEKMMAKGKFAQGSMLPKVEAACRFVRQTGGKVAVGPMDKVVDMVNETQGVGTIIVGS